MPLIIVEHRLERSFRLWHEPIIDEMWNTSVDEALGIGFLSRSLTVAWKSVKIYRKEEQIRIIAGNLVQSRLH